MYPGHLDTWYALFGRLATSNYDVYINRINIFWLIAPETNETELPGPAH